MPSADAANARLLLLVAGFVRVFAAHCYPLVSASDVPSSDPTVLNATISSPTDELFHLLREWADPSTVTLLKAALTVPTLAGALHPQGETARLSLATSAAVLQRLARPAAAEAYEAELARLQAGTPPERQLSLADLRQLCLRHRLMLADVLAYVHPSLPAPLAADAAELSVPVAAFGPGSSLALKQLALNEALQLRRLCPSHPRYAYEAANLSAQLGSLSATQQHLREAVQLAQAADRPLWLARAGHTRVSLEALALTIPANELSLQDMRQLKRQVRLAGAMCPLKLCLGRLASPAAAFAAGHPLASCCLTRVCRFTRLWLPLFAGRCSFPSVLRLPASIGVDATEAWQDVGGSGLGGNPLPSTPSTCKR